ncbi:phospholipase, partial [Bacillus sp. MYb56]
MKRKILAIASVIALTAPIQSVAFAHESDSPIALRWSAESVHNEGVSSHLWIVNRAIDIMSQNTTVVKQNETALLNDWRTNLEEGIYSADYKNPYYDNSTFASHFYDPDS